VTKVLIANRGEIACRIMKTCKTMGLRTVAVHSDVEAGAVHTAMADEAYPIGPAPVRSSYLNMDAVLKVADQSGADLVHPGYGLLSENPEFARRVIDAGLKWVGPSPQSMIVMADKERARSVAEKIGVPIIKGSERIVPDDHTDYERISGDIGFPLLIKATAGGGGIGMRVCSKAKSLAKAAKSVSEMAERSFGDGTILLERYIQSARHVEVQVFGIGDGRVLTLFDRDCSVQRRFQKVIEEAPAPGLSDDTRARMAEAACSLAASQNYSGAGTVEFIYDAQTEEFFFLEMNTRLQVEHPVTEMVTCLDLVELQLRLTLRQDVEEIAALQPTCTGHAIECRIYAEDPDKNFFPAPGTISEFVAPKNTNSIRVDTGVTSGSEVTPYYDPLVAKVIAAGKDRADALSIMAAALSDTRLSGLTTNIDFLGKMLNWPEFANATLHTKIIDAYLEQQNA
jgi:3-methylcrotonyl-CoA carboxylase alpha subunit